MSHSKKSKLKVVPVQRYNRAKYPSFNDPNPIDHPDTLPYPFSEKVFKMLCSMGFTGALLLSSPDEAEAINPEVISLEERDTIGNPFTEEMTGLPFRPASFGTGLPSRLRREDAIGVINRVFREEGISLDSMVNIEKDGVIVTADGYNEEMKLGYVYIDYMRLGKDARINNRNTYQEKKFNDEYVPNRRDEDLEYYTDKKSYAYKRISKETKPQSKNFIKFIDEIYPTLNPSYQKANLKKQYLIFSIRNELEKVEKVYPKFSANVFEYTEDTTNFNTTKLEKYLFTLQVLRQINGSREKMRDSPLVNELIKSIDQPDKKWEKQMNNIYILFGLESVASNAKNDKLQKLIEEAFITSGEARQETFKRIESVVDFMRVDLSEVKNIAAAADQNKYFLAPISQRDPRLTYMQDYRSQPSPERIKQLQERLGKETDQAKKERLQQMIDEQTLLLNEEKVDPKEKPLKLLEEQVRNYIHWAKSQMGY